MRKLLGLAPSGPFACLGMETRLRPLGGFPTSVSSPRYVYRWEAT